MSTITWQGNHLIQGVGTHTEELGYVALDNNTDSFVFWLKDTCGVLGLNGGYIRGEEYPSMDVAKMKAASSPSAFILNYIWMRNVAKQQALQALDDHWEEILQELPSDTSKEDLRDKISGYLEQLSKEKIKEWAVKIGEKAIVSAIIELAKKLLFG